MKILPSTLLALLIAHASVIGAVMYSQKMGKKTSNNPEQIEKTARLQNQLDILKGENETLKKLQVNGAEISLPISHYKFAEKNLGLTFPKYVAARRVDDERLAKAVSYRYTQQFGMAGMEMRKYAFEKLGIMPTNQHLINQLAIAETSGAVAIYDSSANEILLSPAFDEENLLHSTSIIKHLSIALLELNFPLSEKNKANLTDDAYHAREGFIRGRASSIAQRYRNITALKGGHAKQFKPNEEAQQTFNSLPILIRGLTTFPAIHGKTYIEDIMLQNDSVFPELYQHMPRSSATIFAKRMPLTSPIVERKPRAENQHLDTELGQLFIMLYLKQLGDENAGQFRKLTSDQLTITQKEREFNISWKTQWDSIADAQAFYKLATELSSIPEQKPTVAIWENLVIIQIIDTHNS
ncbi:MAG: hypothetical protein ACI9E1_001181 [Cryomorphaceae bacterium]|jgi:hypothetical protein